MLPPVAAISNTPAVAPQRETAVATEVLAAMTSTPDSAVALSLAVSSGVEGKLNMLLINARERMVDSLFAVIDAVSQSLAMQQDAGESNAAYALRLADAITELPPKAMAALQQQLSTQGQTAPLALVAAALHDPTGTEASQLVAYLEVVRYKDKDLATKSVVASYGQNDGNAEPQPDAPSLTPARATLAQAAALSNPATPSAGLPAEANQAVEIPNVPAAAAEEAQASAPSQNAAQNTPVQAAAQAKAASGSAPSNGQTDIAAQATPTPDTQAAEQPIPRANLQIRNDIQEGLKAIFDRLIQATGTELLQTMAEAEPLADKAIAQALIADMIDGTELTELPPQQPGATAQRSAPPTNAQPALPTAAAETADARMVAATQQPAETPVPVIADPRQPQPLAASLVVGFVTTPYAPAEDVVDDREQMRIDRVDAVDDDEHENPDQQQPEEEAEEDETETPVAEVLDLLGGEPDALAASPESPSESRSSMIALPRPTASETLPYAGQDLYQRMGA